MDFLITLFNEGGIISFLPVSLKTLLLAFITLKVLDFITGILKTWKLGNYKSSKMRDGVIRWCAELVAILFTLLMDIVLGLNLLTLMTVSLFVYKECGSLMENLGLLGVSLPKFISSKIEVLNTDKEEE